MSKVRVILKDYIDCIKKIRDPNNTNPNFKVNVIAHSQGGLVARRYILEGLYGTSQNYDPKIKTLITLGTPWVGAPKFINVLITGEHESLNKLMTKETVRDIARYMPGPQELIPSPIYTNELRGANLGDFPFGENRWDYDGRNGIRRMYDFNELEWIMNRYNPPNTNILPGTNTKNFHDKQYLGKRLQDDWQNDQTGITYYNFVGQCLTNQGAYNTVGSIIATSEPYLDWLGRWREKYYLDPKMTRGDCTVPEISSMRERNGLNYRGPAIPKIFLNVDHGGLPNSLRVIDCIRTLFVGGSLNSCSNNSTDFRNSKKSNQIVDEPAYNVKILGSPMVSISDSFGNTTSPLSTSTDEGVATISTNVTGDDLLNAVIPLDQSYKVVIKTSTSPLVITITKNEGEITTLAIRYYDLSIPPDVLALIEITPQGVTTLKYDSNGDGTFDTQVNPTVNVTGMDAQDVDPPVVMMNETVQNGSSQIALQATDTGTGVQRIMYSLNGNTFQQYSTPLILNATQTPTIYAFADDNVANRSGLVTYNLASSTVNLSGIISYGTTPVNQSAKFVPDVLLNTSGSSSQSASSDNSGSYQLSGLTNGGNYVVTPSKNGGANGITSFDATQVLRYVAAGGGTLTANQQVAADTNGSNSITSFDATQILRYVAAGGTTSQTGQTTTWRFLPPSRSYSSLSNSFASENFEAILIGDVNGSWLPPSSFNFDNKASDKQEAENLQSPASTPTVVPPGNSSVVTESSSVAADISVSLPSNATAAAGSVITIPVTLGSNNGKIISGYSFAVNFDPTIIQPENPAFDKNGTQSANFTVISDTNTTGRLGIAASGGNTTITGTGTLLNLRFQVVGAMGSTNLTFNQVLFEDDNGNTITTAPANGSFTVLGTSAATADMSGRVSTSVGRGIQNVAVTITDHLGNNRTIHTNAFGYYHFSNLAAGETYIITAKAKRYTFIQPTLVVNVDQNLTEINFVALP